jgi:molybdenum cofactor biosynthesis enzyme MoaA
MLMAQHDNWQFTVDGTPRGYSQPQELRELWFHTGTACNLECPFCLEGSKPGDNRLDRITLDDARPFMNEAAEMGVEQFSFTGGEPFIVKDFVSILEYAAGLRPCLVLTNGTDPVLKRLDKIAELGSCDHPISFRISIDYPDKKRHDDGRGPGSFEKALQGLHALHDLGFPVSVARQMDADENTEAVDSAFHQLLNEQGLTEQLRIVAFPDFGIPGATPDVPDVTEDCMTRYQTKATRDAFMCSFSKMIVKINGRMRVYACTLVDDDSAYDLGGSLAESQDQRIILHHHRCYDCFKFGSSCSEIQAAVSGR